MRAHQIENGIVINTIEVESIDFLPNLVDASAGGAVGWLWNDGNPTAPPRWTSLQDGAADLLTQINTLCDQKMDVIKSGYPESEVSTWDQQVREALDLQADPLATVPLLGNLATARGLAREELANRVLAKATLFSAVAGQLIGRRQALEDVINTTTTLDELTAIDITAGWPV